MRRSFLFSLLIGFCGGIGLAELWHVPMIIVAIGVGAGLIVTSAPRTRLIGLLVIGLCLGSWRWTVSTNPKSNSVVQFLDHSIEATGDVLEMPIVDTQQTVLLTNIETKNARWSGKVQISLPRFPEYHLGQHLTVRCTPMGFTPTQRWRQWSHGVQVRCFNATVVHLTSVAPSLRLQLGKIEAAVVTYIHRSYNEPQASLLAGIILGNQNGMPAELTQAFQATGTTHIIALSGFNVTIIVSSVMVVLVRLIGRRWAWIPGLLLVILFVVMSGASASVVRAAVMAVIVQLGLFLGRPIHPARLLSYTALIMLWENPLILLHDLGFQLSFLATFGLVFLSKPLATKLTRIPETLGLRENLATTLSAIIATEPLLLWRFGRLSLIAPLVNIVVLPMIPLAMGLGTLSLVGMAVPLIATPIVATTDALLRIILICITTGSRLPIALVYLPAVLTSLAGLAFLLITIRLIHSPCVDETHPA